MTTPIQRVETMQEFLHAAKTGEKPVVYRLKDDELQPCHTKWTDEFLENIDISVGIHRASCPSFFNFNHSPIELARSAILRQTTVGELVKSRKTRRTFWEMISGTDTHLVLENGVVPRWQELWNDCKEIVKLLPDKLYRVGFWISVGRPETDMNLSSQMHWDVNGHHNLNFQVRGQKNVIMFSPDDSVNLYRMPGRLWHLSRIDPRSVNVGSYPLFSKSSPLEVHLTEGDVLLIPAGWWHHVTHAGLVSFTSCIKNKTLTNWIQINVNLTYWYHSKERSGKKWTWRSLFVPKPFEAWFFTLKIVSALLFLLPPMIVWERLTTALVNQQTLNKSIRSALIAVIVPVLLVPFASEYLKFPN